MGAVGLVRGRTRQELQKRALEHGYIGGVVAAGLLLVDLVTRYLGR